MSDKVKRLEKEMQGLAREAIKLLEDRVMEDWGVSFRMGGEIEGWAIRPAYVFDASDPLDEEKISAAFLDVGVGSRIVEKFHKERGKDNRHTQYEFATSVLEPTTVAVALRRIKNLAIKEAAEYGLARFSFAPFLDVNDNDDIKTCGMHINISLWRGEEPLFTLRREEPSRLFSPLILHASNWKSLSVQKDSFFCVAMGDESFKRLAMRNTCPNYIGASSSRSEITLALRHSTKVSDGKKPIGPKEIRIENRLPGSDADPFLAVLTTMASIYAGIKDKVSLSNDGELVVAKKGMPVPSMQKYHFPRSPKDALRILMRGDNKFRQLLNEISAETSLGTRLVGKIAEYAEARYQITLSDRQRTGVSR